MIEKTKNFIQGLRRREVVVYLGVLLIATVVFIGMTLYKDAFQKLTYGLLFVELLIVITYTWFLAGHAVMKSLFFVGASMSLVIFLAQSYCQSPNLTPSGNQALMTLVGFSMFYIGFDFLRALYKEVTERLHSFKQVNNGKSPWFFLLPFAFFVGLFVWQVWQVIEPILKGLCVYR